MLTNKTYDIMKWVVIVVLPAVSTCYFALSGIWGFPYAEQVVGTIAAITTLLGCILGISSAQYNSQNNIQDMFNESIDYQNDEDYNDEEE